MEGFLHIYNKKKNNYITEDKVSETINFYKETSHIFESVSNEQLISVYYTNEYREYPYNKYENHLFCPVGQFVEGKLDIQKILMTSNADEKHSIIRELRGAFALSTANLIDNSIDIFTHVVRAESVYYYEDENHIIVGTDPLVISVLGNEKIQPIFDPANFISFLEQGYFSDELTPFKDVLCLPENSHIRIADGNITSKEIDDTYHSAFNVKSTEDFYDKVTEDLLSSFDIVKDKEKSIRLGLTGGKDSRIVLLALLNKGYNIKAHTTGFPDHPDVIIAQQLAGLSEIPHEVNERKLSKKNQLSVSLDNRIKSIMTASSGLISAYDTVNTKTEFVDNKNFNGIAAAVLKGGYSTHIPKNKDVLKNPLKKPFYKFEDFYLDDQNKFSTFLDDFSIKYDNINELFHIFFLKYRTGRWTSDSRKPKSYSSNSYSVFMDNQFTKSVMKLNIEDLDKERIHYEIIERLNSDFNKLPFFNTRYTFEKNGPQSPEDYVNWLKREPIQATSQVAKYNWKSLGNNDQALVNAFKDLILEFRNNPMFDIIEYSKIEELMNSKLNNRTNKFIWSLASMIQYINIMTKKGYQIPKSHLTLTVASDNLKSMQKSTELIDYTLDYISLNEAVTVKGEDITLHESDKNAYIKTYEGSFKNIPNSKIIEKAKSLKLNTSINLLNYEGEIRKSVIFYTDEKRFKTVVLENEKTNESTLSIFDEVPVPKGAKYYRVILLFKTNKEAHCKLNYSYARINY
ncbi:hypothetical protein BN1048_00598 [Jeotgalicoccus saudimassiliensis]|uniref:Asparagine synthetase domain-containing protein n=1 Tax=Jeotgalicoccus saudimassiliensis TaxID=1461582 RepID=A0A078M0B5_9STAP|nr:hypothetical protein [Jeotgalicoccus saudimassiliensis]CDZ99679.1 hypothetical protein BN1048_00598 [Jeotgalicoccus saudimassiliensis]